MTIAIKNALVSAASDTHEKNENHAKMNEWKSFHY